MKYIPFEIKTGKENMQIDSDLLDNAIKSGETEPIFRLYGWAPACVSLGRNQNDNFLDYEFLKSKNIEIVRRLTGGRALLHDKEITYSYVCPISSLEKGESVVTSYKEISQMLINIFAKQGLELTLGGGEKPHTKFDYCMLISTGADLCYNGKKLIGSAQFRKDGYILQHGSILIDYDKDLIGKIFHESPDSSSITCLKEIFPNNSFKELQERFCSLLH